MRVLMYLKPQAQIDTVVTVGFAIHLPSFWNVRPPILYFGRLNLMG